MRDPLHDIEDFDALYAPLAHAERGCSAQLGQTLDGFTATPNGHSYPVTGPDDHRHLHRLRALHDAVVVGAETVAIDDPQLTVRHVEGRNPVRVVLDPRARLSPDLRVFREPDAATLWVVGRAPEASIAGTEARARRRAFLQACGPHVRMVEFDAPIVEGRPAFEPEALLDWLADEGLTRVLVEGGSVTVSRFLAAGCLDRVYLCVAPVILGAGRPGLQLSPIEHMRDALRPGTRRFALGDDMLYELDFHRP